MKNKNRFKAIKQKHKFKNRSHIFEEIIEENDIVFLKRIIGKPSGKVIFEKKVLSIKPYKKLQ